MLEQDYPRKMLVVVDDGSDDNSMDVVKSYMTDVSQEHTDEHQDRTEVMLGVCNDTPIIACRYETPKKQAHARNIAIQLAWQHAELFCQLDADDLYLPLKLTKSVEAWQSDPQFIGLVYSDALIYDERDDTIVHEFRPPYDRQLLEQRNIISNAPLMSKMALGYTGLYDVDLPPCEDWDLWLRITENFLAVHIPEPLQQYTVTGQNCTFTVSNEKWAQQWQRVQEKLQLRKQMRYGQSATSYSTGETAAPQ